MESEGTRNVAIGHPQRIRRRPAATDLLANGFLDIDDCAWLVHGGKLATGQPAGECLFSLMKSEAGHFRSQVAPGSCGV